MKGLRWRKLMLFLLLLVPLPACSATTKQADIVTTLFAHYDFAKQIVGDHMTVKLLIPPGSEVHGYEPTSQDLEAIRQSRLFLFTSLEMDPWLGDQPENFLGPTTEMINLSLVLNDIILPLTVDDHDHSSELHYWTDPVAARQMVAAIAETVSLLDPTHANDYRANALRYQAELLTIETELTQYLQPFASIPTIYLAGHNALGAFGEHFGIEIVTLSHTNQPDADLTSAQIESLLLAIQASGSHYLFTEELKEPRIGEMLQRELARDSYELTLLELHAYHNITKLQLESGLSYAAIFAQNVAHLKLALGDDLA